MWLLDSTCYVHISMYMYPRSVPSMYMYPVFVVHVSLLIQWSGMVESFDLYEYNGL